MAGTLVATRRALLTSPWVPTPLTLSGNEITDKSRALGLEDDGLLNDSSFGIWPAIENLEATAGADVSFEAGTTGYTKGGTNTIASDATQFKFGTKSCKATYQDNALLLDFALTAAGANPYSPSRWLWIPTAYDGGGVTVQAANFALATGTLAVAANMALRDQWQRVECPNVGIVAGDLIGNVQVVNTGAAPTAGRFIYIDGCETDQSAICMPFTLTTRAACDVQLPVAGLVTPTQGAIVICARMGHASSDAVGKTAWLSWGDDGSHRFSLIWDQIDGGLWIFERDSPAGADYSQQAATFSKGDIVNLAVAWSATAVKAYLNGVLFSTANVGAFGAPVIASQFLHIGPPDVAPATGYMSSDALWVAAPSGLLSDGDAAIINGFGSADPNPNNFPGRLTSFWDAKTGVFLRRRY